MAHHSVEPRYLRRAVLAFYGGFCQYCGSAATDTDHIVPREAGGQTKAANLTAACRVCNSIKGTRRVRQDSEVAIAAFVNSDMIVALAESIRDAEHAARAKRRQRVVGLDVPVS